MGTQSERFTNASAEIKSALKAFHHATSKGLLTHWLLTQRELNAPTHTIPSIEAQRQATNRVLSQGLKLVAQQDEKYAETLRLRFIRGENATQTAILLNTSIPSIYRWQRTALDALTALLLRNEDTLHHAEIQRLRQSLPAPTCEQLVGGIEIRKKVVAHLLKKEAPWLFLMTGIGGIGKTTQINAVVRDVIPSLHFQHILWVTITHQNFGMEHNRASDCYEQVIKVIAKYLDDDSITLSNHDEIKRWMQTERTLLVVDNIEAAEDAVYLWHQLRNWVNPSKIIFTSRASPPNLHQLYTQSLEELSQSDTLTLIRQESHLTNQADLATATDEQLMPIYQHTGGNPFAIKLILGMASKIPLHAILADIPLAKMVGTVSLYRHIFLRAWNTLTPDAKKLLKVMPFADAGGAQPDHMQDVAKLRSKEAYWLAVNELQSLSLLQATGTTFEPQYTIHRLTEQFLKTEIIRWPNP